MGIIILTVGIISLAAFSFLVGFLAGGEFVWKKVKQAVLRSLIIDDKMHKEEAFKKRDRLLRF